MNKADCFNLGYVAKLHGYKGEVSLFFDVTKPQEYASLDSVFIELDGVLVPFFVEQISLGDKGFARVKLEGVDSEEEARVLLKKELFLPIGILPELGGPHFYDYEVVGFTVIDVNYGEIGELVQVIDFSANPLLQIQNTKLNKEVLLPLTNDLVQKVNRENKELHVQALVDLIEMYLGE